MWLWGGCGVVGHRHGVVEFGNGVAVGWVGVRMGWSWSGWAEVAECAHVIGGYGVEGIWGHWPWGWGDDSKVGGHRVEWLWGCGDIGSLAMELGGCGMVGHEVGGMT